VRQRYGGLKLDARNYLRKIIQIYFTIPPIDEEAMAGFVGHLLPDDLKSCGSLLSQCLDKNPRTVKRFTYSLWLYHSLAKAVFGESNSQVMALLLLIQENYSSLYNDISKAPDLLHRLGEGVAPQKHLDERLRTALDLVELPNPDKLSQYIYLSQKIAGETPARRVFDQPTVQRILQDHRRWLSSKGDRGSQANFAWADLHRAFLKEASLRKSNLQGANLLSANLLSADLTSANLKGAQFVNANLTAADLHGADLAGADLSQAKGLNQDQVLNAKNWKKAKLPEHLQRLTSPAW
jgi:hypothetical protein